MNPRPPVEVTDLLEPYFRHVPAEDLVTRNEADRAAMIRAHLALAARRPQGRVAVRVRTPEGPGGSVVEIVTDDMPFLVDSVTAELTRTDRAISLLIHPQITVRRDVTGTLLGLADPGAPSPRDS